VISAGATNPFDVLGLPAGQDLDDDEVRAAWRRIAAATHPDREDGGDPRRYAVAADAYMRLRTTWDRGEVFADLAGQRDRRRRYALGWIGVRGRPWRLAVTVSVAGAVSLGAYAAAGWQPASLAIMTGALTWIIVTGRSGSS
jgi:curved DNA-binding protein CbpA